MHHALFFAATAIDPLVGMVMFFTIALLLHLLIAAYLAFTSRFFVQQLKRSKVSKIVFGTHFIVGGIYLLPIVMQPVFGNKYIRDNLLMLVIGYGLLSVFIVGLVIFIFRTRRKD